MLLVVSCRSSSVRTEPSRLIVAFEVSFIMGCTWIAANLIQLIFHQLFFVQQTVQTLEILMLALMIERLIS